VPRSSNGDSRSGVPTARAAVIIGPIDIHFVFSFDESGMTNPAQILERVVPKKLYGTLLRILCG
jgi:hypothetical protein